MATFAMERKKIPAIYIDFVGTLVGTYDFKKHLEEAIKSTGIGDEESKDPEKSAMLDKEYTRRVLEDPRSRPLTARTAEVLEAMRRRGYKVVIWTSEDPYTVGEILKREGIYVDRIDGTIGYGKPTSNGIEFAYEPLERKVTKAELLRRTEYAPVILVENDPKGLEYCKLSGRSETAAFLCIFDNPSEVEGRRPFEDKQVALGLDVKLFFSRTIEGLLDVAEHVGR